LISYLDGGGGESQRAVLPLIPIASKTNLEKKSTAGLLTLSYVIFQDKPKKRKKRKETKPNRCTSLNVFPVTELKENICLIKLIERL